jgi:hypothetical protein
MPGGNIQYDMVDTGNGTVICAMNRKRFRGTGDTDLENATNDNGCPETPTAVRRCKAHAMRVIGEARGARRLVGTG